jgi:AcrR family transcriptional regulator
VTLQDRPVTGRRRGKALEAQILQAAWTELREKDWMRFGIEGVARRARASKATVYARWPDRHALIAATLEHAMTAQPEPSYATGDLEADLTAFLRDTGAFLAGPFGQAVRAVLSRPDGTGLRQVPLQIEEIVSEARRTGRLGAGDIPPRILSLGYTLVLHHYIATNAAPGDQDLHEIVHDIWIPLLEDASARPPQEHGGHS